MFPPPSEGDLKMSVAVGGNGNGLGFAESFSNEIPLGLPRVYDFDNGDDCQKQETTDNQSSIDGCISCNL